MTWTVNTPNKRLIVNILEGTDENNLIIPPRCEVIRRFVVNSNHGYRFVPNQEQCHGIFAANNIIDSKNAFVHIVNTTTEIKV